MLGLFTSSARYGLMEMAKECRDIIQSLNFHLHCFLLNANRSEAHDEASTKSSLNVPTHTEGPANHVFRTRLDCDMQRRIMSKNESSRCARRRRVVAKLVTKLIYSILGRMPTMTGKPIILRFAYDRELT